jgi:hypothetical protein
MSKVVIHRDFEGEHDTSSESCWCQPLVIEPDDAREVTELVAETEKMDG